MADDHNFLICPIFVILSARVRLGSPLETSIKCRMIPLETISLFLSKRVNPKETHRFFARNEDCDRLQEHFLAGSITHRVEDFG